jgi:hypothetical protein
MVWNGATKWKFVHGKHKAVVGFECIHTVGHTIELLRSGLAMGNRLADAQIGTINRGRLIRVEPIRPIHPEALPVKRPASPRCSVVALLSSW